VKEPKSDWRRVLDRAEHDQSWANAYDPHQTSRGDAPESPWHLVHRVMS
jgi:hypothetical protein